MSKKLKIVSVCGFGVGSSLILKMTIDKVVKAHGIDAEVNPVDVTSVSDGIADLVFTSNEIGGQMRDKVTCPVIVIDNFMDDKEVAAKGLDVIQEILATA
ncbi:PTS sugar transporter subunit IIB [Thaumasiovibrio subtropicus]|uniref:PTS sugar transporter subunit IIB n=1 Tax=Thaumasiovibrio subtropicus TaxID=1891207 RepID=UPI000B3521C9|nr:PTS sugar transporter subunit IIB [Thaumasiovibrio subtropicus]